MDRGFPPLPFGWFVVQFSAELQPGQVQPLHYLGHDLVLFRTASGQPVVLDAHCPHLGAHLGHGAEVVGETIRCPFHHWRFDGQGDCVEVPLCARIPPKARSRVWPVVEHNGLIRLWFHPDQVPPSFEIPTLDDADWTPQRTTHWNLRSHVQEIGENTVDTAHMIPVHHTGRSSVIRGPELQGPLMNISLNFIASGEIIGMEGDNDVVLDVTMHGLGEILVRAHIRNVDMHARYRICCTPVDEEKIEIFGTVSLKQTGDPEFTSEAAELFYEAYTKDFVKDFPIWENKIYRPQPNLSAADGPVGAYRRWARQFYGASPAVTRSPTRAAASVMDSARAVMPVTVERARETFRSVSSLLSRVRESLPGLVGGARGTNATPPSSTGDELPPPTGSANPPANGLAIERVHSVDDYFDTLTRRFQPSACKGLDAVFQWELKGDGGSIKHAVVHDGSMELFDGPHRSPTVTIAMDAGEYVGVVNGDINGPRAFTQGSGKVSGKLRMAMKMQHIFPTASASASVR